MSKKLKLNSFIGCEEVNKWNFGDYIIFQEYSPTNDQENIYTISKPVYAIYLGMFVADQTVGFDFIRHVNYNHKFVNKNGYRQTKNAEHIENHIEWSDYIDILGHFSYRPTWKEILACFRKSNSNDTIKSSQIKSDNMRELDWKKIKETYPKSFAELVKDHETNELWGHIDNPKVWGGFVDEEHYVMRHLFDFFDKRKIMISINVDYTRIGYGSPLFQYSVQNFGNFYPATLSELYYTRQDAEVEAFNKAFKLLEQNLK